MGFVSTKSGLDDDGPAWTCAVTSSKSIRPSHIRSEPWIWVKYCRRYEYTFQNSTQFLVDDRYQIRRRPSLWSVSILGLCLCFSYSRVMSWCQKHSKGPGSVMLKGVDSGDPMPRRARPTATTLETSYNLCSSLTVK
ncbi:hypothetical protein ARMGADRAFT_670868 [Armillaria gallica]|uniref:Uncharacterized protein n=1 Tax=Armillaria gallica TaxID=47427 RepID=A0A2H3CY96_ARMGA|nr:hypothetical protein ARMGADRAFT_670868 [Armillaria gallica]